MARSSWSPSAQGRSTFVAFLAADNNSRSLETGILANPLRIGAVCRSAEFAIAQCCTRQLRSRQEQQDAAPG
jgi:hypothetical protein